MYPLVQDWISSDSVGEDAYIHCCKQVPQVYTMGIFMQKVSWEVLLGSTPIGVKRAGLAEEEPEQWAVTTDASDTPTGVLWS